jgi:redox-sensing transcriptional repressor
MFIGYSSPGRRGYVIEELIRVIATIIDAERTMNVAVIGLGKYGTAISSYFVGKRPKLEIVAAFDADSEKEGRKVAGIKCFHIDKLDEVVKDKNISIAILTVPPEHAIDVKDRLVRAGIKGILNFTSVLLDVPDDVYLEEYDMITSLEKVAYFAKLNKKDIPASEI